MESILRIFLQFLLNKIFNEAKGDPCSPDIYNVVD
jgi:hypothetical protein